MLRRASCRFLELFYRPSISSFSFLFAAVIDLLEVGHFLVQNFDFWACLIQIVVKRHAKKGKLSCCKCIFNQIKANLADPTWKAPKCLKRFYCKKRQESMG